MATNHPVPLTRSLLLRVTRDIYENVTAAANAPAPAMSLPDDYWETLQVRHRMAAKARRRGLIAAADEVELQVRSAAQTLIRQLHDSCAWHELTHSRRPRRISMHDIFRDLLNLEAEFDEVRINRADRTLTVRTESIELDDLMLGPFDIVLDWRKLADDNPYQVIAVHPVHCVAEDSVTHPHVRDNDLCEGDGHVPIASALARGDLFEFFVLVRQILRTYNSASAYQQVDEWFESSCSDCGCSVDEYDRSDCYRCDSAVCNDCCDCCQICGDGFCHECSDVCATCEESVCLGCSEVSANQTSRRCRNCIAKDAESEPTKEETDDDSSNAEETAEEAPPADAPVHAERVGQALVSA